MSYQVSPAQAVESAGKLVKEGAFESVKLEGGEEIAEHVLAHRARRHPGDGARRAHAAERARARRVQGAGPRRRGAPSKVLADARALEEAGAYAIVLEAIPPDVAARGDRRRRRCPPSASAPGRGCDGQVLVCTDLLGMSRGHSPKFAKRFAELGDAIVAAFQRYVAEVQAGAFPGPEHAYKANGATDVAAPRICPRRRCVIRRKFSSETRSRPRSPPSSDRRRAPRGSRSQRRRRGSGR